MVDGLWMEFPPTDPRYNAAEYRRLLYMLTGGQQSVFPDPTGLKVSQRGAGANMSVDVATGSAVVLSTESTRESYQATFPAVTNLVVPAAHASSITKHLVVVRFQNALEFAGSVNTTTVELLAGTSGANTDPTLSANSLKLARLTVPAAASSVTNAMITDLRPTFPDPNFRQTVARITMGTAVTILNNVIDAVPFTTADIDRGFNIATGPSEHYNVPDDGDYEVSAHVIFGFNNANQRGTLFVYVNGSNAARIDDNHWSGLATNDELCVSGTDLFPLNAGDAVTIQFRPIGSSSNNVQMFAAAATFRRIT